MSGTTSGLTRSVHTRLIRYRRARRRFPFRLAALRTLGAAPAGGGSVGSGGFVVN